MVVFIWILVVVFAICGIGGAAAAIVNCDSNAEKLALSLVSLAVAAGLIFGSLFWLYGTESGGRAIKSFEANTKGGIERSVTVYDVMGNEIQHYEGKFDVEHTKDRIMFDDEDRKRHIVYYTTGTVIVDEK